MTRYELFGANDTPMTRDEIVEENAIRFHVEDDHDGRFATCKKDCWFKSEQLFIEARNKGELVPIIEDEPLPSSDPSP